MNSKWIKGFNIEYKTIKLVEENIGENLYKFRLGNKFLYITPKA